MTNLPASTAARLRRVSLSSVLAFALLGLAVGNAGATALPIYKCMDRSLGILYTDVPCKEGEKLDVRAGNADPAAIARLDREREAWDRTAAQRIADERRTTLEQRRFYNDAGPTLLVQEGGGGGYYDYPDYAYFGGWGYGGYGGYGGANGDRRRHFDGRDGRDGHDGRDGRFDRRGQRTRVVPAMPRNPAQAHR